MMKQHNFLRALVPALIAATLSPAVLAEASYDLVILGGRVMDPETNFDAVRNVGVRDGRIIAITEKAIKGDETIDAVGMVVSPGFIDTHLHGQDPFAIKMSLRDGVTSSMDLEAGAINISDWYAEKENQWQMNYGTSASHLMARMAVLDPEVEFKGAVDTTKGTGYIGKAAADGVQGWAATISNTEQLNKISQRLDEELRQGAIGLGSSLSYMGSAVSSYEMFELQRTAARYQRVTAVHTRYHMNPTPLSEAPIAFDEILANAVLLKAPMLVVHNNDHGWEEIEEKLQMARAQGLNMWSEHYPYAAVSTFVGARFFTPEVWVKQFGYSYADTLYSPEQDQFLDQAAYEALVKSNPGAVVIAYIPKRQKWMPYWLSMPHMTVASDGMVGTGADGKLLSWDASYSEYAGHPRVSGSYAKTLRLGREYQVSLMQSLSQLSYWSAKHLGDAGLKSMQERGRLQQGMVADITVFNPATVTDNSTYKAGEHGLPATGIPWVIVNGQIVVKDSKVQKAVYPGQAIRYPVEDEPRFKPLSAEKWIADFTRRSTPLKEKPELSHLH